MPVPIFASELADPEKGTGILMVCTFGDATDVLWWREQRLALRQLVGKNGRLVPLSFGAPGFESLDPEAANRFYAGLAGKPVAGARKAIVELLRQPEGSATGSGAPLQGEPRPIQHTVKFYEKGDRPLEFVPTRQWFVRLLDKKAKLLAKGAEIQWHPPFMGKRFADWTENLSYDWCVSRQRYFGVPIPVWYPLDAEGRPEHERPLVAERDQLPVDPTKDAPQGYREAQRGKPGGFVADTDIFDTWFTSSMTPQIGSHWGTDPKRHAALFPADMRPQAHDIIRTWAFYTIAKAHAARGPGALVPRGDLGVHPRPRAQEDVEEQGQRGDADPADRAVRRRRHPLLGRQRAARRRHRDRRERLQGGQAARRRSSSTPASSCSPRAASGGRSRASWTAPSPPSCAPSPSAPRAGSTTSTRPTR